MRHSESSRTGEEGGGGSRTGEEGGGGFTYR